MGVELVADEAAFKQLVMKFRPGNRTIENNFKKKMARSIQTSLKLVFASMKTQNNGLFLLPKT